jgi:hypothetical protein
MGQCVHDNLQYRTSAGTGDRAGRSQGFLVVPPIGARWHLAGVFSALLLRWVKPGLDEIFRFRYHALLHRFS